MQRTYVLILVIGANIINLIDSNYCYKYIQICSSKNKKERKKEERKKKERKN